MFRAVQYKAPIFFFFIFVVLLVHSIAMTEASGDLSAVCLRNCAQCKKMFGAYFEGQLCAEACIKFNGQLIPECTDTASIAPFLNKMV